MSSNVAKTKLFKRQSGQIQAVHDEVQEILDATKEVFEKMTSDPPPPLVARRQDPNAGLYSITEEQVEDLNPPEKMLAPRPRPRAKPEAVKQRTGSKTNEK